MEEAHGDLTCSVCERVHRPDRCQGHRRPGRSGDPITQCRRHRDPEGGDFCWAHIEEQEYRFDATHPNAAKHDPKDETAAATLATTGATKRVEQTVGALGKLPTPPAEFGALFNPDAPAVDNPVLMLAKLAGVLHAAFVAAGERVNALTSISVETRAGGEQLRGEVLLWEKLIAHLRAVLVDMAKLDLDTRLVRLEERRADMVAEALWWLQSAVMSQIALDTAQSRLFEQLMRQTVTRIVTMGDPTPDDPALITARLASTAFGITDLQPRPVPQPVHKEITT